MKSLKIIFLCFIIGMTMSCDKESFCEEELICEDESCLFTINNIQGEAKYFMCYDRWGIYAAEGNEDGSEIWLLVENWDSKYEEEGLSVTFCGYVKENTFPLLMPDPMFGVYQIDLVDVKEVDN